MSMKSGFFSSDEKAEPVLSSEHIRALSILTYSDNAELQRSAALCMLEISERCKCVYISSHMFVTLSYRYMKNILVFWKQRSVSATCCIWLFEWFVYLIKIYMSLLNSSYINKITWKKKLYMNRNMHTFLLSFCQAAISSKVIFLI